jgi:hypothetical protein
MEELVTQGRFLDRQFEFWESWLWAKTVLQFCENLQTFVKDLYTWHLPTGSFFEKERTAQY